MIRKYVLVPMCVCIPLNTRGACFWLGAKGAFLVQYWTGRGWWDGITHGILLERQLTFWAKHIKSKKELLVMHKKKMQHTCKSILENKSAYLLILGNISSSETGILGSVLTIWMFWDKREAQYSAFFLALLFSLLKCTTSKPVTFFDMDWFSLDFHMHPHSEISLIA